MKKAFILAIGLTGLCVSLFAAEEPSSVSNQYGYMNLGLGPAPLPIPQFGVGYRMQKGNNGFDANLLVSTIVVEAALKFGLDYLYYMNPDRQKEFYVGVGPAFLGLFHSDYSFPRYAIAPEFIFGKQYVSDTGANRHFQANLMWPTFFQPDRYGYHDYQEARWYPYLSFSYGWGF